MQFNILCLSLSIFIFFSYQNKALAQHNVSLTASEKNLYQLTKRVSPLDTVTFFLAERSKYLVSDAAGKEYEKGTRKGIIQFIVTGNCGVHRIAITNNKNKTVEFNFIVEASTNITGNHKYEDMFNVFKSNMMSDTGSVTWNGKRYRYFVPWVLDHFHTMKGLKYFQTYGGDFVDLMRQAQRSDGMIYSFVEHMPIDYFRTRDSKSGYTKKVGDKYFVRQPTENHPEYIFVNTIYEWWKASGDNIWMKNQLNAAIAALNYSITDSSRWSNRFKLLKRVYTIDSWDFQVDDEYTPDIGLTNTMIIDTKKSKFGIFFGDNTGYIDACVQLAEMLEHSNRATEAQSFRIRAGEIRKNLDNLSWNGNFYTHFIEEDSTVKRNLGVDERSQLAQSNAYSINRQIDSAKKRAIIETYYKLKNTLPAGSPGEWYSIYPPFERGFEIHGSKWQYMNGGVGGHVAAELSRGALANGYESYGLNILDRLYALGKRYGDRIYFSYTGAIPISEAKPTFKTIDLTAVGTMDLLDEGSKQAIPWMKNYRNGDDLRNMPTGNQSFNNIPFLITDPSKNDRKSAVAVSRQPDFPSSIEIPVNQKAGALYLLHTSSKPTSENISGAIEINFEDGSTQLQYIIMNKHLAYWWFPKLENTHAGIAWYGENNKSKGIGISWCALSNQFPSKQIRSLTLRSAEDQTIYTVLGLTLSDIPHQVPVNPVSFGGPDNWAAATAMASLIEGVAGAKDLTSNSEKNIIQVTPRWTLTDTDSINVCVTHPSSGNYIAYKYHRNRAKNIVRYHITSNNPLIELSIPLSNIHQVKLVTMQGRPINYTIEQANNLRYIRFFVQTNEQQAVEMHYTD